jgi:hypothetical protein
MPKKAITLPLRGPLVFPTYPYMIKYLLETYALDDELAQASIAVTNRKAGGKKLYISSK